MLFKKLRQNLSMSQSTLAHAAGISLPSVQNLEAGKANPSFETLKNISEVLGVDIELKVRPVDWNLLAAHGAPISATPLQGNFKPNRKSLALLLKQACIELSLGEKVSDHERKQESVAAVLLAIHAHYPPFYLEISKSSKILRDFSESIKLTGRLIKLKRLALASVSEYL